MAFLKKLTRSVQIFRADDILLEMYTEGMNCSTIEQEGADLMIIFRAPEELKKEKPYKRFSGYKFVITEIDADLH